ncbi:OLC1v1026107C1 [Oldenlandia corymbosa var. corymbosa]|uniref:OLC1v1026107C1 n=1 Tax=Oldenlandia corymbosa var. corymbosa TaxID=529605 RepID=A0AAV1C9N1_OLDCO|nr:OLC1v1026107C1 [Oldenlandia corymbosa var. corymbosa]
MDFSGETSQQSNPYINVNDTNPLQFTIHLPTSTSNPNPSPSSSSSFSVQSSDLSYATTQTNSVPNPYFPLSIPRKRRRGRPRNTTSPLNQVYSNLPTFSNSNGDASSLASSSGQFLNSHPHMLNPNFKFSINGNSNSNSNSSISRITPQNANADVSDEIIVINKEATAEALIALTAGFPADSLTEEEIDAGVVSVVGGIEQVNYILIRNHIITKWRENVSRWVSKDMFSNVIPKHCSRLLETSYEYLVSRGYINFGVASAVKERIPAEPSKQRVIVIGAGLAGLAAARQLLAFGFRVTVLEGRKRAGGRVYTKKMEVGNRSAAADLGGSVLTGTLGNPLGILARQLSHTLHKIRDKCPLYRVDGQPVDADLDQKVEIAFNRLLDKASKLRQLMGEVSQDVSLGAALETFRQVYGDAVNKEELSLFNWHLANLEYANAGLLSQLSLAFWDQDDPYDMGGDHCFLAGGNGRLVQALAENIPILYEKTVQTIRYGSEGVQVVTSGGQVFDGDVALCTVPLGVLKNGSIKFIPELPQRKLDTIKRLGFGLLNKVAMLFPHVFWGTDLDTFGHLTDDNSSRGEFFLFYSYATVAGGALLIALVAGEAAHKFETMPPTDAVTHVLQILKGIYEPQGIEVPEPIQTVCTRWGADPFSLGSYSNVAVGASGDDYDILAESVGDGRLFFAGEATNRRYPATMHGALLSGFREAANIAQFTSARATRSKIEKNPSKNAHSCASLLADLFREPDLEFGSFSVIFGRRKADLKLKAILRVTFSGSGKRRHEGLRPDQPYSNKLLFQQLQSHFNQQQELHVYTLLSRQQALELREVRGGDEMRLHHLSEKLGVKLVGRKGLGPLADSVIASIKSERAKSGNSKLKSATLKQKMIRKAKILRKRNGNGPVNTPTEVKEDGTCNNSANPNRSLGSKLPGNVVGPNLSLDSGASVLASCNSSTSSTLVEVKVEGCPSLINPKVDNSATITFPSNLDMFSGFVDPMVSNLPPTSINGVSGMKNDDEIIPAPHSDVGPIFVGSIDESSTLNFEAAENLVNNFSNSMLGNIYEDNMFGFTPPSTSNSGSW